MLNHFVLTVNLYQYWLESVTDCYCLTIMMGLPAPRKMKDTMGWWQREADQYCRDMILKPNVVLNN